MPSASQKNTAPSQSPPQAETGILASIRNLLDPAPDAQVVDIYRAAAERVGGTVNIGATREASTISVSYKDATITFTSGTQAAGRVAVAFTSVVVLHPPFQKLRFELGPDGVLTKIGEGLFRVRDLFPGESGFDAKFTVNAKDEQLTRKILGDSAVQSALMNEPGITIRTKRGGGFLNEIPKGNQAIIMRLGENNLDLERVVGLIQTAKLIYDRVHATRLEH